MHHLFTLFYFIALWLDVAICKAIHVPYQMAPPPSAPRTTTTATSLTTRPASTLASTMISVAYKIETWHADGVLYSIWQLADGVAVKSSLEDYCCNDRFSHLLVLTVLHQVVL